MKDIQEDVMADFRARRGKPREIVTSREAGRYATRVRIVSVPEQPTSFDGTEGVVARIEHDTYFVRFRDRGVQVTLPFARSQLEVLP